MNFTKLIGSVALAVGLLAANVGAAQAPAGAPAGATGLCNDGTYFKGTIKTGACSGHKGLKTWYGVPPKTSATKPASSTPSKPAMSSSAPAPAPKPAAASMPAPAPSRSTPPASSSKTSASQMAQASGGGPGMVWVNTASKVYHCPGTQYYGKTKAGKYMSESDAKAAGNHPVGGKPCGK